MGVEMRMFGIVGVVLLAQGCALFEQGPMSYDSTFHTRVNGTAFYEDSAWARVGMYGTTCDLQTRFGMPSNDYDYPGVEDRVIDIHDGFVLVGSEEGAWLDDGWGSDRLDTPPVLEGRVLDDGLVLVRGDGPGDCSVAWTTQGDTLSVGGPCDGFDADRASGDVFVGSAQGLKLLGADGVRLISDLPADALSWDPGSQAVFAGRIGDSLVRALELDGEVRWEVALQNPLREVVALGDRGVLAALVEEPDGRGTLLFIDAWSGLMLDEHLLPQVPAEMVASPRGDRIAMDRVGALTVYRVDRLEQ